MQKRLFIFKLSKNVVTKNQEQLEGSKSNFKEIGEEGRD